LRGLILFFGFFFDELGDELALFWDSVFEDENVVEVVDDGLDSDTGDVVGG